MRFSEEEGILFTKDGNIETLPEFLVFRLKTAASTLHLSLSTLQNVSDGRAPCRS